MSRFLWKASHPQLSALNLGWFGGSSGQGPSKLEYPGNYSLGYLYQRNECHHIILQLKQTAPFEKTKIFLQILKLYFFKFSC